MTRTISGRVAELGLALDPAAAPAANYVPFVQEGNLLYISGQISRAGGKAAFLGQLGNQISDADGVAAARLSALGILAPVSYTHLDVYKRQSASNSCAWLSR